MISVVIFASLVILSIAYYTSYSLQASKADVASSKSKIFAFLIKTRAIASLCFYPPDKFKPLSPSIV